MTADPNDQLDDVLAVPDAIRRARIAGLEIADPTTIADAAKLAKRNAYAHKLAAAEAELDRWLTKLMRASNRVDAARKAVKRYRKLASEDRP